MTKAGKDYIGVGVGALIFNQEGKFLMALRGSQARNERGKWEIPGGAVELWETFEQAIVREVKEEIGVEIEVVELLTITNHLIEDDQEHWVSPTYICRIVAGQPQIMEPSKCTELRWFSLEEAEQVPLSLVTRDDIVALRQRKQPVTQ